MGIKRLGAFCLVLILSFLAACGGTAPPAEGPVGNGETELSLSANAEPSASPTPVPTPEPTLEPTPEPAPETGETISLNTDDLVFEHKGEKAEIYSGDADPARVNWETDDSAVAIVSEGTVMAIGPGETTIRALYGEQEVFCKVLCTAPEDEYAFIDPEILHAPRLVPPYFTDEEDALARSFFDDAAILGDSISYVFYQWEMKKDWLGNASFLVRGGISLESAVTGRWKIYYQGVESSYADALAASGAKKAFILLGTNDLCRFGPEGTLDYYKQFVDQLLEKNPDVDIYIQSITPVWTPAEDQVGSNATIDEFNVLLRAYAEENGYFYVDLASYLKDYTNGLAQRYSSDKLTHFSCDGCCVWAQVLKQVALERLHEED